MTGGEVGTARAEVKAARAAVAKATERPGADGWARRVDAYQRLADAWTALTIHVEDELLSAAVLEAACAASVTAERWRMRLDDAAGRGA